jgi:hypothetical protein
MELTKRQIELVKDEIVSYAETHLYCDEEEAKIIAKDYLYDVVEDIKETAVTDWETFKDDEICFGDARISIERCLADYNETDEDDYDMDDLKNEMNKLNFPKLLG